MPEKLDRCVSALLSKWKSDPDEAPKKYKSGDEWKEVKGPEDLKSAAFAICRASTGLCETYDVALAERTRKLDLLLDENSGAGPVLRGVGFVNRPYIKHMDPLEVQLQADGSELIRAQIVRFGIYAHPHGPDGLLPFTHKFWRLVRTNWENDVYGQKVFADKGHAPNAGSFGELVALKERGPGMDAWFKPTPAGLKAVKDRDVNYASIDLEWNFQDTRLTINASDELSEVVPDDVFVALAERQVLYFSEEERSMTTKATETPQDQKQVVTAEELQALQAQLADQQEQITKARELHAKEVEEFRMARAQELERLRRSKVAVFLQDLAQPKDGKAFVKPVLDLIGQVLLGDQIEVEGTASIQLGEDPTPVAIHAYYRQAVERLAELIPRTVPVGSNIQATEVRPGDNGARLAEREAARQSMEYAVTSRGGELTEEKKQQIEERLDRVFGGGG